MISLFSTLRLDKFHRPRQIYRHKIGTPIKNDQLIYEEKDKGFTCGIGVSSDEKYYLISRRIIQHLKSIFSLYPRKVQNLNYLKRGKRK